MRRPVRGHVVEGDVCRWCGEWPFDGNAKKCRNVIDDAGKSCCGAQAHAQGLVGHCETVDTCQRRILCSSTELTGRGRFVERGRFAVTVSEAI